MKIGIKILVSFFLIILSIAVMGYMTISSSQERLIDNIGQDYSARLHEFMRELDENYQEKIVGLIEFSDEDFIQQKLIASNDEFDNIDEIEDVIFEQNEQWIDAIEEDALLPSIQEIQENELSKKLKDASQFFANKYNYYPYIDISILNAHGAVIANVKNPIEYSQIDSDWWDDAVDFGFYVGEVLYDDESKIYSQDVVMRIDDSEGNFIGFLKTKVKLQDILIQITELKQQNMFLNSKLHLIDDTGKKIFSTDLFEFGDGIPIAQFVTMTETNDFFLTVGDTATESLFAYSRFDSETNFPNIGWILMAEQQTESILTPVVALTNTILIISVTTITSAITVALYVRSSITKPLVKLKDASTMIAEGDYDFDVNIKTDDEIEDLATTFEYMRDSVNYTNENLRDLIKLRTEDLTKTTEELKENKSRTDDLVNFLTKQIHKPITSLMANIDLLKNVDAKKDPTSESVVDVVLKLNTMTSDLTDLYNAEQNKIDYDMEDVQLNSIITDAVSSFITNPRKNVELKINLGDDVQLFVDKSRLKRVISNIVNYSLKSTKEGYVEISTNLLKNNVEILFIDTRGEFEQNEIDKILEFQSSKQTISDNDTIGLHVAKSIIKGHAGTIQAAASDVGGITITVKLPIFEN